MASEAEAGISARSSTARGTSVGDPWFSGGHANATCVPGRPRWLGTRRMAAQPADGEARAGRRAGSGPTYPPPQPPGLSPVLTRNIQALERRGRRDEQEATAEERIAEAITRFTGSMRFVYLHLAFFGFWIVANLGWLP